MCRISAAGFRKACGQLAPKNAFAKTLHLSDAMRVGKRRPGKRTTPDTVITLCNRECTFETTAQAINRISISGWYFYCRILTTEMGAD